MSKKRDSKKRVALVQLFAERSSSAPPERIHVVPIGEWDHPVYGLMKIDADDVQEFVRNFNDGIRRDIPITAGHDNGMSGGELPAVAWFTSMTAESDGLWGDVNWNDEGKELLVSGAFKYFSPEFYEVYEDPQTHEIRKNVLVGGALTNKPYFKELTQVYSFSEDISKQVTLYMDLKKILAKAPKDLSDAEKAFLRENAEKLNDEQKRTFSEVIAASENDDDNKDGGDDEGGGGSDDGDDDGGNGGDDKDEKGNKDELQGSEVKISAAELAALKTAAEQGAEALRKVQASERKAYVDKMIFSTVNTSGRFFPNQREALEKFVKTLSESQRDQFGQIVQKMPKLDKSIFTEVGSGEDTSATRSSKDIAEEVKKLANEKITAAETKGKSLKYSEAVRQVYAEKPELKQAYDAAKAEEDK